MDICGREGLYMPEGECECPGGGEVTILAYTYSQVKALRDNGELIPGQQYRIKNYECTTTQVNTSVVPHSFDIIVTADNETTLNENARAVVRSNDNYYTTNGANLAAWEIKYSIDNDTARFGWADATNGKGVIYYMKDEHGNSAPYDFKQIVFARYQITEADDHPWFVDAWITEDAAENFPSGSTPRSVRSVLSNGITLSDTPTYFFTFSYYNGSVSDASTIAVSGEQFPCFENHIAAEKPRTAGDSVKQYNQYYELPDNVFVHDVDLSVSGVDGFTGNTLAKGCTGNTFGRVCHNNTLGEDCKNITVFYGFESNEIGDECSYLYFGPFSIENIIGQRCYDCVFENTDNANVLGPMCFSIFLASTASHSTFASACNGITLDTYGMRNVFGAGCVNINLGSGSHDNVFGPSCFGIEIDTCVDNTFGSACSNITATTLTNSAFDNGVFSIALGTNSYAMTFESGVNNVDLSAITGPISRYDFLAGTSGLWNDPITFNAVDNTYTQYVAKDSNGTLKIWNPAD